MHGAGDVVNAFAEFVAGGSLVVGIIIFVIIVVIQFVVITKGATRISEVAARFMLGRHARQADGDRRRPERRHHRRSTRPSAAARRSPSEADFYGAMDGASKFVRGDAIAGIIITFVNILGGLVHRHGRARHGTSCRGGSSSTRKLTIGDGLVSQVPAFIDLAGGRPDRHPHQQPRRTSATRCSARSSPSPRR